MKAVPSNRAVTFALIAVVGCAVDLLSKLWIFNWLGMPYTGPSYWLVPEIFGFTTSLNEGALFGIGQGWTRLFAVLSIVAAVGIVYWLFWLGAATDWLLTIALALIMGGIFGNLYDRLGMPGLVWGNNHPHHVAGDPVFAVRDFVHFKIDALRFDWPIFNLADCFLVCGAALLILHSITTPVVKSQPAEAASS
jgi:signal peptidase II